MKDVPDQRHQQQQEREEGQNGVGGNGEGEGVHLGPEQIAGGGAHDAFGRSRAILGRAFLVGKLDGSERRHWFLKYYQILTAFRRGLPGSGLTCVALIEPGVMFVFRSFQQLRSCQPESSCYYLLLVSRTRLASD